MGPPKTIPGAIKQPHFRAPTRSTSIGTGTAFHNGFGNLKLRWTCNNPNQCKLVQRTLYLCNNTRPLQFIFVRSPMPLPNTSGASEPQSNSTRKKGGRDRRRRVSSRLTRAHFRGQIPAPELYLATPDFGLRRKTNTNSDGPKNGATKNHSRGHQATSFSGPDKIDLYWHWHSLP